MNVSIIYTHNALLLPRCPNAAPPERNNTLITVSDPLEGQSIVNKTLRWFERQRHIRTHERTVVQD